MAGDANRSRRLGDIGWSDPANWCWGGADNAVDLVVMLFAKRDLDAMAADSSESAVETRLSRSSLTLADV